MTGPLRI